MAKRQSQAARTFEESCTLIEKRWDRIESLAARIILRAALLLVFAWGVLSFISAHLTSPFARLAAPAQAAVASSIETACEQPRARSDVAATTLPTGPRPR